MGYDLKRSLNRIERLKLFRTCSGTSFHTILRYLKLIMYCTSKEIFTYRNNLILRSFNQAGVFSGASMTLNNPIQPLSVNSV
jgi:hypothetical protein